MINFDEITHENQTKYNPSWPYIPDHLCRKLIISGSRSGKTNALLNLVSHQRDIDKICLYAKNPFEPKYQLLIKKCEDAGIKYGDSKASMQYSNTMDDVYNNINDYNLTRNRKILIMLMT